MDFNQISQQLSQEAKKLRNEVVTLQTQKQELGASYQRMLSRLVFSKHVVDLLQGSAYSLRYEITELISIVGFIVQHLFYAHVEEARKLDEDHFNEFVPYLRAGKGEDVSMPELKTAVATAIEVLLGKLNSKEVWLVKLLSGARVALTDKQENNNVTSSLDKRD